ncbi:alcohol dehydrogenase [Carex littledalei]|uniref:alcohol dehydrogenase n=1 Tax=Carex littledalei TaxID=544730 RepID=A0A833RM94_9POAL|nr:alcohol dehydrogenase [Carex littledalei]
MCDLLCANTDCGVVIVDSQSCFSIRGKPIYYFFSTSTFSKYAVIHIDCVAKINPKDPLYKICVLSCIILADKYLI